MTHARSVPQSPTKETTQTRFIQDAVAFIPSSYIAQGLGVINAFLIRRLLGPTMMGIWSTVQIVLNYGGYLHLGSMHAGAKEIPFHLGRKDPQKARHIQNNIFTFGILSTSLGAVLLMAGGSWFYSKSNASIRVGIIVAGFILVAQRIYNLVVMLLRGYKNFTLLSKLTIFTAVTDVLLTGGLVWFFGIYGLYAAVLSSLILSSVFVWGRLPHPFSFELDRKVLRGLTTIAFPMFVLGIFFTLLRTVDKIMIVKYMGAKQLGIYSVALMASNFVFGISNMIGMLTLPRYSEKFGDKGDVALLGGYMDQAHRMMGIWLPVLSGVLYFIVPVVVKVLLKQYTPGIPALQVLLFGTFFLCLVNQPHNFLLAIGQQLLILPSMIAGVVVSFLFNYWVVQGPKDLTYVAVATSLSYVVVFLVLFMTCSMQSPRRTSSWWALGEVLLPFIGVLVLVWVLDKIFEGIERWWVLPVQLILYGLVCVYPVRKIDEKTQIISKTCMLMQGKILSRLVPKRKTRL